jgi:hypothetical protein
VESTEKKPVALKHTPGPWRMSPSDDGCDFVDIHADDWGAFARVVIRMENDDADSPEGLANANLILAAPDMLAALKIIVDAWLSPLEKRALKVEMCEAARTAIAKAERGQ